MQKIIDKKGYFTLYTIIQRIYEQSHQLVFREMRDLDRRKKVAKRS